MMTNSQVSKFAPRLLAAVLVLVILVVAPKNTSPYLIGMFTSVLMWGAMASSFNILGGFAGQVCFIPPLFVGIGAYISTWLLVKFEISPWIGMLVASGIAALIAAGIGYLLFRYGVRDVYFALGTMAIVLIGQTVFLNLPGFGGAEGLYIIIRENRPLMMQFVEKVPYYYMALALMVIVLLTNYWISKSKLGYWFRAIRENQWAAEAIGVNVMIYKLYSIIITAFLLGLLGTFWAQYVTFIDPYTAFHWEIAGMIIIIAVAGGSGTVLGPLLGALILVPFAEIVRARLGQAVPGAHMVIFGAILMLILLYLPGGFISVLDALVTKLFPGIQQRRRDALDRQLAETRGEEVSLSSLFEHSVQMKKLANEEQEVKDTLEPEPILQFHSLTKVFGGLYAVDDFSAEARSGQILGIIGPNGAGKTTTFNLIAGTLKPTKGRVIYRGEDITDLLPHQICEKGIARTFQIAQSFPKLTALETVMVGAFLRHPKTKDAEQRAYEILEVVHLRQKAHFLTEDLTLADLKRLEVAKALATDPEVVLLDEVIAGLTEVEVREVIELLRRINKETGITFIMIEHVMQAIISLCDHVVVLNFGQKISQGTPETVTSDSSVIEAYLGRPMENANA